MAICPICNRNIDFLHHRRTGVETSTATLENGIIYSETEFFDADGQYEEYACSECGEVLFESDEEAIEFLEDKDELQKLMAERLKWTKKNY